MVTNLYQDGAHIYICEHILEKISSIYIFFRHLYKPEQCYWGNYKMMRGQIFCECKDVFDFHFQVDLSVSGLEKLIGARQALSLFRVRLWFVFMLLIFYVYMFLVFCRISIGNVVEEIRPSRVMFGLMKYAVWSKKPWNMFLMFQTIWLHLLMIMQPIAHICHLHHLHVGGEEIWHVEKFQISIHGISPHEEEFQFFHTTDVEKCESLPNLVKFHISPQDRCEEIWNLSSFLS